MDDTVSQITPDYNWTALKVEFLASRWVRVSDYLKAKKVEALPSLIAKKCLGWAKEKNELNKMIVAKASEAILNFDMEEEQKRATKEAIRMGKYMMVKGEKALEKVEPEDVDQARKLIEAGNEMIQAATGGKSRKGGGTNLTQVNLNLPKTKLDELLTELDYEGTLRLIAEVKRTRAGKSGEDTVIEGAEEA